MRLTAQVYDNAGGCSTVEKARVPPGQRLSRELRRLDLGVVPRLNESKWRLRVEGLVEKKLNLTLDEIVAFQRTNVIADFHCVTGWSRLDNRWEGIPFKSVVEAAKPRPEVKFVTFECGDGYTTSLPLSDLLKENVLLALSLDGQRLTAEHGGPLRLIVPEKYAYKSAKWVEGIRFTAEKELGYWEERGYSDTADPWTEDRYAK